MRQRFGHTYGSSFSDGDQEALEGILTGLSGLIWSRLCFFSISSEGVHLTAD